jgi:hypothetical protein
VLRDARAVNDKVRLLAKLGAALIEAKQSGTDLDGAVAAAVGWDRLAASVAEANKLARPAGRIAARASVACIYTSSTSRLASARDFRTNARICSISAVRILCVVRAARIRCHRRQPRLEHQLVAEHVHSVGRSRQRPSRPFVVGRTHLELHEMADKDRRPAVTPTKGDGSKTEFATPATACQECETRCQKARLAACRPTHKATRTANRRPARQRHRHGSGGQGAGGCPVPPRRLSVPACLDTKPASSRARRTLGRRIAEPLHLQRLLADAADILGGEHDRQQPGLRTHRRLIPKEMPHVPPR